LTRIGPAGWAYKDWHGIVYPARKTSSFQEVEFLSHYFDTLEINVSFYKPVEAHTAERWLEQIKNNPRFRFTAKLWRRFTHDRDAQDEERRLVREGLDLLKDAGRLGALLLQFPHSFRKTEESLVYLTRLRDLFSDFPLVLEVRHQSWAEPGTLEHLESLDIGLCNIDQPIFATSLRPAAISTGSVAYVRLHGRKYETWFTEERYHGQRYDYKYSMDELAPWVDRIKTLAADSADTYVITNNHYVGKAVVNALEIAAILKGEAISGPPELIKHYPELEGFILPAPQGPAGDDQLRLF
jgi:uncharacterized protein YecE (DUF72 family)